MLSINKLLCATTQYSSRYVHKNTIQCYGLRFSRTQIIEQRYAHTVPEKYIVDEEDAAKYKLPSNVKRLKHFIVYSDFIEKRKLKSGYKLNKAKLNHLRTKAKIKGIEKAMMPVYSSMLKHLSECEESKESEQNTQCISECEESQSQKDEYEEVEETEFENHAMEKTAKPIHMPYAATDLYENVEVPSEPEIESNISDLNEKYKRMYEKYLDDRKTKKSTETMAEILENNKEHEESSSVKLTNIRPFESTKSIPPNWMTDYEQFDDSVYDDNSWKSNYGTPNPEMPVSSIPCGGCGALLHCKDPAIPGYLPSELFVNQQNNILKSSVCQRCHFIKNYKTALDVKVSPDDYPALLSHIKTKKVAVILMVDLTDFPCSIWPGIIDIIGKTTNVYVVGNKVDLLPNDGKNFLKNVEKSLIQSLNEMGIGRANIKSVNLISAKTGYGIEELINKLHKHWEYKGDVYMIGCTNVGKSSLFNALLRSDYCKVQAADLIQRATISPWPGTTLNLLKFPILNPARWRLYMRMQRLKEQQQDRIENQLFRAEKLKDTKNPRFATLQGHIGKTFEGSQRTMGSGFFGADPGLNDSGYLGFNEKDELYVNSRWCFDTPGTIHPDQVVHLLTTEELMRTLPQGIIRPRTFDLGVRHTLFLAGLGRLDFVNGGSYVKCTVFASHDLPVTICETHRASQMYKKLLKTDALAVPINDPERLKLFPALQFREFTIMGINSKTSASDIVLSSAGWIAITAEEGMELTFKAWTPEGRGLYLRTPAMLSRSVNFRGWKIPYSPAYYLGKQVYSK